MRHPGKCPDSSETDSSLGRTIGLPDQRDAGHGTADESALHRRQSHRLVPADHLGLLVASREGNKHRCNQPDDGSRAHIHPRLDRMETAQAVECAHGRHDEGARYEGRHLIVCELDPGPGIEEIIAEAVNAQRAIRFDVVPHRMLHKGICHENEVRGQPASQRHRQRGQEVKARPQVFFGDFSPIATSSCSALGFASRAAMGNCDRLRLICCGQPILVPAIER